MISAVNVLLDVEQLYVRTHIRKAHTNDLEFFRAQ